MDVKEIIKAEIKRLNEASIRDEIISKKQGFLLNAVMCTGEQVAYDKMINFINSLQLQEVCLGDTVQNEILDAFARAK